MAKYTRPAGKVGAHPVLASDSTMSYRRAVATALIVGFSAHVCADQTHSNPHALAKDASGGLSLGTSVAGSYGVMAHPSGNSAFLSVGNELFKVTGSAGTKISGAEYSTTCSS